MTDSRVTIIDYGMGNLWSVMSALHYLGCNAIISNDPAEIVRSRTFILPGVGSFRNAMNSLKKNGIDEAIIEAVRSKESKILGICLGMQLLGISSTEDGDTKGLGLIPSKVEKISVNFDSVYKIPHVGFNTVFSKADGKFFKGINRAADFYFVHSYRMMPKGLNGDCATCNYGENFLAAYHENNVYATQFHPEKSQTNGLALLSNFLSQ
jgi:glutamine amidotransferase